MVNAQQWLDTVYPARQREGIIEISAYFSNLEGELKLTGFPRLLELGLNNNKLTRLEVDSPSLSILRVVNNPDLIDIYCSEGIEEIHKDNHTTIHYIPNSQEKLEAKIQALENQLATNQQTHTQALQAQITANQAKDQTISQLQTNLTDLEIQIRNHEQAQELITKLQQDNRDLLQDIHQAKQNIQTYEQTINNLEGQIQANQQRILTLEADKTDLISQLTQTKQKEKAQIQQEIQLIKEVIQ